MFTFISFWSLKICNFISKRFSKEFIGYKLKSIEHAIKKREKTKLLSNIIKSFN